MWKKLYDILKNTDVVMLTSPHNMRYFSGFSGGEGVCIIGNGFRYLFVDSRYTIAAKQEAVDFEVIEFSGGKLLDEIASVFSERNVKKLSFEDEEVSFCAYNTYRNKFSQIEFEGVSKELSLLRMVKTEYEIQNISLAEKIGDIAFERVLPRIKKGVAECEIAAELEYQMRLMGAEKASFETVVVSGVKSGMPHGKPDGKKLEAGDFLTMDFGCVVNGYCSDMTRTVIIEKATDKQKEIYNTVLKAQLAGLNAIQSGIKGKDADAVSRDIIKEAGYGKCFGHSLGHGVGLLIHEQPNLSPLSETVLEENMIVTCEPGIYIENFGGVRIEDTVVVKKSGFLNLSSSPKELIICE